MSYIGQIAELPLGPDGLTGTKNLSKVRLTQLLKSNGTTYENGTIQKEGGASKYNATAVSGTPQIIAGWDWVPSSGVQHMIVVTSAGRILRDTGAGTFPTRLASGLTATGVIPIFVDGGKEAAANNRKLFCFTGKNAVRVLSATGATMTTLASGPADWAGTNQPTFGLIHEARLWGGGNANDPHRLYYSRTGSHESFSASGSGTLAIYPGEGEGLTGGISFKGYIICFKKPKGVYVVDTTSPTVANWKVKRVTKAVGLLAPLAASMIDNDDVLFMDETANFQLLSAVQAFGDVASHNLSQIADMEPFIRENLALGKIPLIQSIYYAAKREAHFAVPQFGATTNTARLVVDFNRLDLPRFRWSDRDVPISLWLKKDSNGIPRPMMGDDAGFIWNLDQAAKAKAGVGYTSEFQIPHIDLSHVDPKFGTVRKKGDFLELVVEPKGNWNLSVDILWDGVIKQTVQFNMGQAGGSLGSFVLDTDVLGGDAILNKKKRITGSGRRFSYIGRSSGASQDYSISKFYLHFRPTNEKL